MVDQSEIKDRAKAIVGITDPDDVFVVEEGFDDIADNWYRAGEQDEGRFVGGAEIASFAGLVVPFLLGLFADAAKGVVTDQAKRAATFLLDQVLSKKASPDEAARFGTEIEAAIAKSRFSNQQKETLKAGFKKLLTKVAPAK